MPKNSWAELVGENANSVMAIIEKDNPCMTVVPLPMGYVRLDISCCNQVYVSIDENGNVTEVPIVG